MNQNDVRTSLDEIQATPSEAAPQEQPNEAPAASEPKEPATEPAEAEQQPTAKESEPAKTEPEAPATESKPETAKNDRFSRRVQNLDSKLKAAREENQRLQQLIMQNQINPVTPPEGGEVDLMTLNQIVQQQATIQTAEMMRQQQMVQAQDAWQEDLRQAVAENPQLDEKSDKYDAEKANLIAMLLSDPNTKGPRLDLVPSDVISRYLGTQAKDVAEAEQKGQAEAAAALARQQAESAVPTTPAPVRSHVDAEGEYHIEAGVANKFSKIERYITNPPENFK